MNMNERLTDEEIHALWVQHVGTHTSHTGLARAIESAVLARAAVPAEPDQGYSEDDLIRALAECRDAFPAPDPGAPGEHEWMQAIGDPLSVPTFIKASLAAPQAEARQEQPKPHDFITHKEAWREALRHCAERADTGEDAAYWQHELRAYDKAHAELAALSSTPAQGDGGQEIPHG
jgi:hypothetical protein